MNLINQIMSFEADPIDRENYATLTRWNPEDPSQDLRIDRNQKFYILSQSAHGIQKVVDVVKNFFIKWIREGWNPPQEKTEERERRAKITTFVNGYLRPEMAAIAKSLIGCTGILDQEKILNAARQRIVQLIREGIEMQKRCAIDGFQMIEREMVNLSTIPSQILAHEDFPNQLPRHVRAIFEDTFRQSGL